MTGERADRAGAVEHRNKIMQAHPSCALRKMPPHDLRFSKCFGARDCALDTYTSLTHNAIQILHWHHFGSSLIFAPYVYKPVRLWL